MKTINKFLILMVLSLSFTSCLVDDDVMTDAIADTPDLVGFMSSSRNALVTEGTGSYDLETTVGVIGPNIATITEDVQLSIEVNAASTAIEGVHYTLGDTSLTLSPSTGLSGVVPFTVLSDDSSITAPSSFTLILDIVASSGGNGVIPSGKTGSQTINISYLCNSDLAGAYVTTSGPFANVNITELADGVYEHDTLPGLSSGGAGIPFEFSDSCGTITIDTLVLGGGYLVQGSGVVDPVTGVITINGYILYNSTTVDSGPFFDNSGETFVYTPN